MPKVLLLPRMGVQFIAKLLKQPMIEVLDPVTRSIHTIDPQTLAHRILQVRRQLTEEPTSCCCTLEGFTDGWGI